MKKALLLASLLGSMVALADADSYLYWMITTSDSYEYARIRAAANPDTATENYLTIYNVGLGQISDADAKNRVTQGQVAGEAAFGDGLYAGMIDSANLPASFIVELYNAQDKFISQSVISSSAVANYLYRGGIGVPPSSYISVSSFAIPEPSSGLLMLVGCAVLGLRRRKQKNA